MGLKLNLALPVELAMLFLGVLSLFKENMEDFLDFWMSLFNISCFVLGSSGCTFNNGNCTQLCFPLGSMSVKCACAIGYHLLADGKTCDSIHTFLIYSTSAGR